MYNLEKKEYISKERKIELVKEVSKLMETFFCDIKYNITYPIENSFVVLEKLGCLILGFQTEEDISGFLSVKNGIPCIFINTSQSLGRQYFSAWHEYYHYYSGEKASVSYWELAKKDETEFKADTFAGMVLIPEKELREQVNKKTKYGIKYISKQELVTLQNYFHVSYSSLVTRLIQTYPDSNLSSRYVFGRESKREELLKMTEELGFSTDLISPTKDLYITPSFFDDLEFNVTHGRISKEKGEGLVSYIQEKWNFND